MSISRFVLGRRHPNNSSLPQLKLNLPLLLLPRVSNAKRLTRSSKPNLARVMHRQKPLPDSLGESRSGNPLLPPRMWHPFPRPPRHGSLHSCWMVSLSLPLHVYGYGRRVKGEGGRVVQSLVHGLLLPEDVHTFKDGTDKSLGRRLQWHTVAVILNPLFFLQSYASLPYPIHVYLCICIHCCWFVRPLN